MATFNWGDGTLRKFHETLKDALDPNSIMPRPASAASGTNASAAATSRRDCILDTRSKRNHPDVESRLTSHEK